MCVRIGGDTKDNVTEESAGRSIEGFRMIPCIVGTVSIVGAQ